MHEEWTLVSAPIHRKTLRFTVCKCTSVNSLRVTKKQPLQRFHAFVVYISLVLENTRSVLTQQANLACTYTPKISRVIRLALCNKLCLTIGVSQIVQSNLMFCNFIASPFLFGVPLRLHPFLYLYITSLSKYRKSIPSLPHASHLFSSTLLLRSVFKIKNSCCFQRTQHISLQNMAYPLFSGAYVKVPYLHLCLKYRFIFHRSTRPATRSVPNTFK